MSHSENLINDTIASNFVARHVGACVTDLVDFVLTSQNHRAPFSESDIINSQYDQPILNQFRYVVELDERESVGDDDTYMFTGILSSVDRDGEEVYTMNESDAADMEARGRRMSFSDYKEWQRGEILLPEPTEWNPAEEDRVGMLDPGDTEDVYRYLLEVHPELNLPRFFDATLIGEDEDVQVEEVENEPLEWYIVDSFLFKQLKSINEAVIDGGDYKVWGRGTSGAAVKMDEEIITILRNNNYLVGQKYEETYK